MRAASQVSSRAVTFVLNLIITRMLSPEAYGVRQHCRIRQRYLCPLHGVVEASTMAA